MDVDDTTMEVTAQRGAREMLLREQWRTAYQKMGTLAESLRTDFVIPVVLETDSPVEARKGWFSRPSKLPSWWVGLWIARPTLASKPSELRRWSAEGYNIRRPRWGDLKISLWSIRIEWYNSSQNLRAIVSPVSTEGSGVELRPGLSCVWDWDYEEWMVVANLPLYKTQAGYHRVADIMDLERDGIPRQPLARPRPLVADDIIIPVNKFLEETKQQPHAGWIQRFLVDP